MSKGRFSLPNCVAVWALILSLCAACGSQQQRNSSLVDDLLHDRPCALPCWHELMPGQSSEQQAIDVLFSSDRSRYIGKPSLSSVDFRKQTIITWKTRGAEMPSEVSTLSRMEIVEGLVDHIFLVLDPGLTAQMVIDKWGMPSAISVYTYGRHRMYWWVNLYYPALGVDFTVWINADGELADAALFARESLRIEPSNRVLFAYLYVSMTEEKWLDTYPNPDAPTSGPSNPDNIRNWPGFGPIPPERR
jgi:hypothetical protein